jgi:hypothetical protein
MKQTRNQGDGKATTRQPELVATLLARTTQNADKGAGERYLKALETWADSGTRKPVRV